MKYIAVHLLVLGLLPLRANAQTQNLPLDVSLLQMQSSIRNDVEAKVKNEILDPVLGKGKSSVFADIELEIISRRADQDRTDIGVSQKYREKGKAAGLKTEARYILPGIPEPRSVLGGPTGPEDALGKHSQQKRGITETRFGTEVDIKRFQLTVIHDEALPKEALDTARGMINDALLPYKVKKKNPPTVVFKPARFKVGMLEDLKRPGVYLPLLYAFLLLLSLLFLFGPLSSFLKKYVGAIMAKPAAEVNVESRAEGAGGGGKGGFGGGAGEGRQQIDMMFQPKEEFVEKFDPFSYINEENLKRLVYMFLLRRDEPWVIALVLSYLKPEFARQVLSMLPLEIQAKVAMESMKIRQLSKEQVKAIDTDIKEGVDFVVGGVGRLIRLLEDSDANTKQNILEYLKVQAPSTYEKVKKSILMFEDIAHFPDRDMQTIIRALSTEDIARALQKVTPEISEKFFSNMSKGGTALLNETMEFSRNLADEQIEDARTKILDTIKTLEKEAKIVIREQISDEVSMDEVEMSAGSDRERRVQNIAEKSPAGASPGPATAPAPAEQGSAGQFQQYLDAGISLYNEGRYEECISYLQYAAQGDPSLWQAYQYLGGACYALGRTSEAFEYYEKYASQSRDPAVREWVDNLKQQAGSR